MFNLGLFELGLFGVIALIVLGPDKLPQAARMLGKWYALLMHAKNRLTHDMMTELELLETQEQIKKELAILRQSENAIKAQMMNLERSIAKNEQQILSLDSTANDQQTQEPIQNPPTQDTTTKSNAIQNNTAQNNTAQNYKTPNSTPNHRPSSHHAPTAPTLTTPMTHRFFLLGAFDKKKRLPPAPFLPNTTAEQLLYQTKVNTNTTNTHSTNGNLTDTDLTQTNSTANANISNNIAPNNTTPSNQQQAH